MTNKTTVFQFAHSFMKSTSTDVIIKVLFVTFLNPISENVCVLYIHNCTLKCFEFHMRKDVMLFFWTCNSATFLTVFIMINMLTAYLFIKHKTEFQIKILISQVTYINLYWCFFIVDAFLQVYVLIQKIVFGQTGIFL